MKIQSVQDQRTRQGPLEEMEKTPPKKNRHSTPTYHLLELSTSNVLALLLVATVHLLHDQSPSDDILLPIRKISTQQVRCRVIRRPWQEKGVDQGQKQAQAAFYDEEPLPAGQVVAAS